MMFLLHGPVFAMVVFYVSLYASFGFFCPCKPNKRIRARLQVHSFIPPAAHKHLSKSLTVDGLHCSLEMTRPLRHGND